ncbi:APC family permease [uncultured Maritalea sp.]|uniref:APC family permease n=1 Tax=uncultured Maritalea sp. TaxID=757249 RepID=UPI002621BE46|nr:amino acid permease [uncultured Maritalea sp.]
MSEQSTTLKRTLTLPLLIFYGVGVTIGAGIFALIGETISIAGNKAPIGFVLAGIIAAATGLSYAKLAAVYPRAAGEAVFVNIGMGQNWGRLVGIGVTITAIVSSAVIAIAFAGYLGQLIPLPAPILVIGIVALLTLIACLGVTQSVIFAAIITAIELGALILIVWFGANSLTVPSNWVDAFAPPSSFEIWPAIFSAALLAFFAFVGFEDIANVAEEVKNPRKTLPLGIITTLVIATIIYFVVVSVVVLAVPMDTLIKSSAPLALIFENTDLKTRVFFNILAIIATINGALIQVIMASRVLYGLSSQQSLPSFLSYVNPVTRTPITATFVIIILVIILAGFLI